MEVQKRRWPAVVLLLIGAAIGAAACFLFLCSGAVLVSGNVFDLISNFRKIGEVSAIVQGRYIDEVDDDTLFDGASKGIMASLGDPYAAYYTAAEFERLSKEQQGRYVGLGVSIATNEDGNIYIVKAYSDSPAERCGMKPGDVFCTLNGENMLGAQIETLVAAVNQNSSAPLTIVMLREDKSLTFQVMCEEIVTHRVHPRMIDDLAYIAIDEFTGDCSSGFAEAISMADMKKASGMIIDLRNNPGGNLDDVLDVADKLLDEGLIISISDRYGKTEDHYSDSTYIDLPLAVLINGHSASASEVLAGAVQDHKRGTIIGTQSFGKGIVQTVYGMLSADGHVKLTTAKYYTPSGRSIHGVGITPDIKVDIDPKYENTPVEDIPDGEDAQLQAAIRALRK